MSSDTGTEEIPTALSPGQRRAKRLFDVVGASLGLLLVGWLIGIAYLLAKWDTGSGFFRQERIGLGGETFTIIKIQTMRADSGVTTTATRADDPRITPLGRWLRRFKIDELPQLLNVLRGEMSFVGPRPDVPGFADRVRGGDRIILSVRPGLTSPATLKYRNEENVLQAVDDPDRYNREVIFPEKVRLNREYLEDYSFFKDLEIIVRTMTTR